MLRANYLQLKTAFESGTQEVPLYRYAVGTVGGEKLSKPKMRLLVANLIQDSIFAGCQVATDYSSIVVTTKKLDLGSADRKQGKIEVIDPTLPPFQGPDSPQAQEAKNRRTKGYELSKQESSVWLTLSVHCKPSKQEHGTELRVMLFSSLTSSSARSLTTLPTSTVWVRTSTIQESTRH